jgi:hypothetical protein
MPVQQVRCCYMFGIPQRVLPATAAGPTIRLGALLRFISGNCARIMSSSHEIRANAFVMKLKSNFNQPSFIALAKFIYICHTRESPSVSIVAVDVDTNTA